MQIDYAYGLGDQKPGEYLPWQREWRDEIRRHDARYYAAGPGKRGGKTRLHLAITGEDGLTGVAGQFLPFRGMRVAFLHETFELANTSIVDTFFEIFPRYYRLGEKLCPIVQTMPGRSPHNRIYVGFDPKDPESWMGIDFWGVGDRQGASKFANCGVGYNRVVFCQMERSPHYAFNACVDRLSQEIEGLPACLYGDFNYDELSTNTWPFDYWVEGHIPPNANPKHFSFRHVRTRDNPTLADVYTEGVRGRAQEEADAITGDSLAMTRHKAIHTFRDADCTLEFDEVPWGRTWTMDAWVDMGHWPHPLAGLFDVTDHYGNHYFVAEFEHYKHRPRQSCDRVMDQRRLITELMAAANGNTASDQLLMWRDLYAPPDFFAKKVVHGITHDSESEMWERDPEDATFPQGHPRAGARKPAAERWRGLSARKVSDANTNEAELAGIKQLVQMFWFDPEHIHPVTGKKGSPRAFVIRPKAGFPEIGCRRFHYQLNRAQVDPRGLLVKDESINPHAEIQGAVMHWDVLESAIGLAGMQSTKSKQIVESYKPDPFGVMRDRELALAIEGSSNRGF